MSDFDVLIDFLSRQNSIWMLYWIFGGTLALVALFFISRFIRNITSERVRQISEFGMDFDAVAKMLDKGLLTPEEAKRVKSVLARHFSKLYEKKPAARTAEELLAEEPAVAAARTDGAGPKSKAAHAEAAETDSAGPTRPPRALPPTPAPQPRPSPPPDDRAADVELPPDIMDMYNAGMIDDDELEALRRFYAARAKRNP